MKRGCRKCEQWMEHCYWDHHPKNKRFLKTLTGEFSQLLRLPKKFMIYFKDNASPTVHLEGPAGDTWHVGLVEIRGNLCLENGWKEFVTAHHLRENDTLLFKYKGDSHFRVLVFDASECEKESAYFVKNKSAVKQESGQMEHEDTSEPELLPQKKYQKAETACPKREGYKSDQNLPSPKPETVETSEFEDQQGKVDCSSRRRTKKCAESRRKAPYKRRIPPRSRVANDTETKKALQLASAFQPSRPSFISVMKNSSTPPLCSSSYYLSCSRRLEETCRTDEKSSSVV